eukprot:1191631-Prorocentrum_minimum.AAC.5
MHTVPRSVSHVTHLLGREIPDVVARAVAAAALVDYVAHVERQPRGGRHPLSERRPPVGHRRGLPRRWRLEAASAASLG